MGGEGPSRALPFMLKTRGTIFKESTMTARTATRTTGTGRTTTRRTTTRPTTRRTKRTTRVARTSKSRTPKTGKLFAVPVNGKKTTYPSAWYFGR